MPNASNTTPLPPIFRAADWEERLAVFLDGRMDEPFAWGSNDCGLFAAGAIRAMTGVDIGAAFRGTYSDAAGAAEALRQHGEGTLLRTMTSFLGKTKHSASAHRGDIMVKDRTTLGVCVGLFSWFVGEEGSRSGLVALPTSSCRRAFTIPYAAPASDQEGDA